MSNSKVHHFHFILGNIKLILLLNIADKANGKLYILLEARLCALYKSEEEYEILERFKGETLRGKKYLPLFPYFSQVLPFPIRQYQFNHFTINFFLLSCFLLII